MKTEKITVNKTAELPAGVEIDLVVPDGAMEEKLLSFMLMLYLRDLKREKRVTYELPERFVVDYRGQGRFVASDVTAGTTYYEAPKPVCIVGLRWSGGRFDMIHAPLGPVGATPQQPPADPPALPQEPPADPPAPPQEPPADPPVSGGETQA